MKIAIVGLGLMGGSLALALKRFDFVDSVVGYDHNERHKKEAIELSLVDSIVEFEDIKKSDVIFLAIPVNGVISSLKELLHVDSKTTIIDLGSTKEQIVKSVPKEIRANFVASHPMTGTENFGPTASVEGLYEDRVVVLCDLEDSGEIQQKVAKKIFEAIGMNIHYMKSNEHDRHTAFISHMPHAISFSIANAVIKQEDKDNILTLAAGGFRSMSRLAKSSPYMWEDIFKQNSRNILEAIELFEDELKQFKSDIKEQNWNDLSKKMQDANKLHDILR